MKKIFLILVAISLYSCSSIRKDYGPVNDYLDSIAFNEKSRSITLVEEKINSNLTLSIFKGKSVYSNNKRDSIKVEGVDFPIYNYEDWLKMNNVYKNTTNETWLLNDRWKKTDFKLKNIIFMKYKDFPKADFWNDSTRVISANIDVYALSNPIYYMNGKYAIFSVSKCGTANYTYSIEPKNIVIMKKKRRKWVVIQKISDGNY